MPKVFSSYAQDDLPQINQLETQLKNHADIVIWHDQGKIYGKQKWPKILSEAIAKQEIFLLICSKRAVASYFAEQENIVSTLTAFQQAIKRSRQILNRHGILKILSISLPTNPYSQSTAPGYRH